MVAIAETQAQGLYDRRKILRAGLLGCGALGVAGWAIDAIPINGQMEQDAELQAAREISIPSQAAVVEAKRINDIFTTLSEEALRTNRLGRVGEITDSALGNGRALEARRTLDDSKTGEIKRRELKEEILIERRPVWRHWLRAGLVFGGAALFGTGALISNKPTSTETT